MLCSSCVEREVKYKTAGLCRRCYSRKWMLSHYPKNCHIINARTMSRWREHRAEYVLISARMRAKKRGIEFSLRLEDIVIPEICPVFGTPLAWGQTHGDLTPTLDRVDNTKGYVPNNVKIISSRANRIKSDASLSELEKIVKYVRDNSDFA